MTIQSSNLRNRTINVAPCRDMLLFYHFYTKRNFALEVPQRR